MDSEEFRSPPNNYPPSAYGNPQFPYQPGQFQQPPYHTPPPPPPTYYGPGPHNFRGWALAAFVICYLAALIMSVIDALTMQVTSPNGSTTSAGSGTGVVAVVGACLLIALVIFIIIKDKQSYFTLYGKLHWKRMNIFLKILLGLLYLVCWVMTPIYIVMAIRYHLRMTQQTLGQSLQSGWSGFRAKRTSTQVGLGLACAFLLVSFVVFTSVGAMADRNMALGLLTPTASPRQAVAPTTAPTPTSIPIPKPTPRPIQHPPQNTTLAATHDTPRLGGPVSDFIGRYGPPDTSCANCALGYYNFQRIQGTQTDYISTMLTDKNGHVNSFLVQAPLNSDWDTSTANALCESFGPSDVNYDHPLKVLQSSDGVIVEKVYKSAWLAGQLSVGDFQDNNTMSENTNLPLGTFDISYSSYSPSKVSDCSLDAGIDRV